MKAGVAALLGGVVGGIGVLCFLVAFGTDYWLLAIDDCHRDGPPLVTLSARPTNHSEGVTTSASLPPFNLHHEGFFWRCWFHGDASLHVLWAVLFTNQPAPKFCIHGYLFPLPVAVGPVPHPAYDATAVFRGFWTLLIILGVATSLTGSFLLLCAVPFTSAKFYSAAGVLFIAAACLFLTLVSLFLLWKELVADVRRYVLQEAGEGCPLAHLEAHYGWSFMVAVTGVPLVLLSGLIFYFIGKHIKSCQ